MYNVGYPLNTSMEQMANVNNRYVGTAEEVKLFLALIEEKNIAAILDGKKHNSTVYSVYDKPWNVCTCPLQPNFLLSKDSLHLLSENVTIGGSNSLGGQGKERGGNSAPYDNIWATFQVA